MCTFAAADVVVKTIAEGTGRKLIAGNGQPVAMQGRRHDADAARFPDGFFSMPWPNDIRHKGNGTLDLTGFPGTAGNPALSAMLSIGSANTRRSGRTRRSSCARRQRSIARRCRRRRRYEHGVEHSAGEPRHARRRPAPLLVDFNKSETTYRPANLLSVLPPSRASARRGRGYALIVLDGVRDVRGLPLVPPPLLADLDQPWDSGKPVVKTSGRRFRRSARTSRVRRAAHRVAGGSGGRVQRLHHADHDVRDGCDRRRDRGSSVALAGVARHRRLLGAGRAAHDHRPV